jgi:plastin-1
MTEEIKEGQEGQEVKENPDDLQFFEELQLDDFQEYEDLFKVVCDYKAGKVEKQALKEKLFELRFRKLSDEDLDRILEETEFTKDGAISIFNCIIFLKKIIDAGTKEKFQRIVKKEGMGLFRVVDKVSKSRKKRQYSDKEKNRYAKLINKALKDDPDCGGRIPIDPETDELYDKIKDGVILCKLVNKCEPDTINEDEIKKNDDMNIFDKYDNLTKAIEGGKKVGVSSETNADDVLDGDKERDNDLLGDLLARLTVPKKVIKENPESQQLLNEGETVDELADLPINDFLKRWFNKHLKNANHPDEVTNFTDDVKDSEKYTVLLTDLSPQFDKSPLDESDPTERAKKVLDNAVKYGAETTVLPEDISSGNEPLNRLFTGDLYNAELLNAGDDDYDKDLMKTYIQTMNKCLCDDEDTRNKVPIDPDSEEDVFEKLKDGVVLGKLENLADKDLLHEDSIKTGDELTDEDKNFNAEKVIDAADKLGCPTKLKPNDILRGKKKKDQDIVGDVLERVMVPPKTILNHPDSDDLVKEGETKEDLAKGPVDDFLKRWVNKHLKLAGHPKEIENFGDDVKDGEVYTVLLNNLAPEDCDKSPLDESDPTQRMAKVINNAKNIGVDSAATPEGFASGKEEFGKLFLGEIYNAYTNPYNVNEKECYCKIINDLLANEEDLKNKLPIVPESNEVFKKIKDGIILAKLVNLAAPGTVDERVIVKDPSMTLADKQSNLNSTIMSAKSIGCMIEATSDDVLNEVRKGDIDLLYQILKPIVYKKICVQEFPQMLRFKHDKEEIEELLTLGPEDFLKRWFNYHLNKAGHQNTLTNFSDDVKDSEKYTILLNQLDGQCDKSALDETDQLVRAGKVLENAPKIGAKVYIKNADIANGNEHLNRFFSAELFMANHGLGEATQEEKMLANKLLDDDEEGDREERSFRTWINSLKLEGVKKVNNLYQECRNAILLLKIIDTIKPGTVNWKIVELKNLKNPFKVGVNCQEAIDSSKRSGYKIVSIGNKDIQEGRKKHILAIVWQLMRAHTLKVIGERSEEELIAWANEKVSEGRRIKNLKEKKLSDGLFWIELLSAIEPKCIRWDFVVKDNPSDKDKEMNAKYALSVARGLGALIFVVWEDITEVKSKLLLTFLASIYDVAQNREKKPE